MMSETAFFFALFLGCPICLIVEPTTSHEEVRYGAHLN
jgi:hypothetical protein